MLNPIRQMSRVKLLLIVLPLAAIIAFFAMNPDGAFAVLSTTGNFIVSSILNIFNLGLAGIWWVFQAIIAFFANLIVGAFNAVVNAINSRLSIDIPTWGYITSPTGSATFQNILATMGQEWATVQASADNYVAAVSQTPYQSAAIGLGTSGVTTVATVYALSEGGITPTPTPTPAPTPAPAPEPKKKKKTGREKQSEAYEKAHKSGKMKKPGKTTSTSPESKSYDSPEAQTKKKAYEEMAETRKKTIEEERKLSREREEKVKAGYREYAESRRE